MEEWLLSLDRWSLFYLGGMIGFVFSVSLVGIFVEEDTSNETSKSDAILGLLFGAVIWPVLVLFLLLDETSSERIQVLFCGVVSYIFAFVFPYFVHSGFGPLVLCGGGIALILSLFILVEILPPKWSLALAATLFLGLYTYQELTITPEEQLARERAHLAREKRELEEEHTRAVAEAQERVKAEQKRREREAREAKERRAQELKDARIQVEIAKVKADRAKLRNQSIPKEVADQIAQANKQLEQLQSAPSVTASTSTELAKAREELARLKREGVDYSKLSEPKITSAPPVQPRTPSAPIDEQTKLILSGLWLGACFFLQRVFEKLFKDKGYALLTVCAAGFLLAFFTANYFLLGGSVTGGLIGSVGDRG